MQKRGQVSVEYLIVLGMAMILILPGAYLFYAFSKGTNDQLVDSRLARSGLEIVNTAESMYAIGRNSWSTVQLNLPEEITTIKIEGGSELVIQYETQNGQSQAVFFSNVNMSGPYPGGNISSNLQSGFTRIKVSYNDSSVVVEEIIK